MKVLVTGGAGQVGSHVAEMLMERGDHVIAIDNLDTGRREHLPESHPNLTYVQGDISDKALIDSLFEEHQPEVVVHTAASYKHPRHQAFHLFPDGAVLWHQSDGKPDHAEPPEKSGQFVLRDHQDRCRGFPGIFRN